MSDLIESVHAMGAKRHGADWLNANEVAVDTLWASKLRPSDREVKRLIGCASIAVRFGILRKNGGRKYEFTI
jgi:hypothetical protein